MAVKSQHELDLDGIDFTGRTDYGGVKFFALGEGATLGNPEPVDKSITTALLDGSFVVTDRHENREPSFMVQIEAANSDLLDQGQAMLFGACSRQVLFGWKPPDGWGKRRVYRAFTSHLAHAFDDLAELPSRGRVLHRTFKLTLSCDPWAYAAEPTVTVASAPAPAVPSSAVIADGTSATGWTSPSTAAAQPTVVSSTLSIAPRGTTFKNHWASESTRTGAAIDFSATSYVSVDVKAKPSMVLATTPESSTSTSSGALTGTSDPRQWAAMFVDGVQATMVTFVALADGWYRYTWRTVDTSATTVRIVAGTRVSQDAATDPTGAALGVYFKNLTRSNLAPGQSSSGRQLSLALPVKGSARTTASIEVAHATAGLGDVIFYTSSALGDNGGYSPPCRPYLASPGSTTTADTAMVSGSYTTATGTGTTTVTYARPASSLAAGSYLVLGRVKPSITPTSLYTVSAVASMVMGSTTYSTETLPQTVTFASGVAPSWSGISEFGVTHLPQQDVPRDGSTAAVTIAVTGTGGSGAAVMVDEVWLCYLGDGAAISRVNCGTGTPALGTSHNYLWLDQPNALNPKPRVFVGTQADRSDAFNPGASVTSWGMHPVKPPLTHTFLITTGATYPTATYTYTEANS